MPNRSLIQQRQQVKEAANWQCQNPYCARLCRKPGESFREFIERSGADVWAELEPEYLANSESPPEQLQAFILKAMPNGQGKFIALCGTCAIQFVQPSPGKAFSTQKLELQGQLPLPLF